MRFIIPTPELRRAVNGLKCAIEKFVNIVRLRGDDKGLTLAVNGLNERISYYCPEGRGGGECFLNACDLIDFLKVVRGDTVEIVTKGNNATLRYVEDLWQTTFETKLAIDKQFGDDPKWIGDMKPFADFLRLFRFALPFSSADRTRYALNGVYFDNDENVVATDGRRLTVKRKSGWVMGNAIVPNHKWLRTISPVEDCMVAVTTPEEPKRSLFLTMGRWQYETRLIEGTFPNFEQVIPAKTPKHTISLLPESIEALKFVQAVIKKTKHSESAVAFSRDKSGLYIKAQNDNGRMVKAKLAGESDAKDVQIALSVRYFVEAMKKGFTTWKVEDPYKPVMSEHDGWTHILMPMRIS